jgi:hypothetical protein
MISGPAFIDNEPSLELSQDRKIRATTHPWISCMLKNHRLQGIRSARLVNPTVYLPLDWIQQLRLQVDSAKILRIIGFLTRVNKSIVE